MFCRYLVCGVWKKKESRMTPKFLTSEIGRMELLLTAMGKIREEPGLWKGNHEFCWNIEHRYI